VAALSGHPSMPGRSAGAPALLVDVTFDPTAPVAPDVDWLCRSTSRIPQVVTGAVGMDIWSI